MKTKVFFVLIFVFSALFLAAQNSATDQKFGARYEDQSNPPHESVRPQPNPELDAFLNVSEGFDDITTLAGNGWVMTNNSNPLGITNWFQGNSGVFSAFDGTPEAYIAANFNNTTGGTGTISNWLIAPEQTIQDGDVLTFYTRTAAGSIWPDRLEVRLSPNGSSSDVGATEFSVGDFTMLLLSVNPNLIIGGYPESWTQYSAVVSGLGSVVTGRFALRYFVTDGGPTGVNSNFIGIDRVEFTETATVPVSSWAIAIGIILITSFVVIRYRRIF